LYFLNDVKASYTKKTKRRKACTFSGYIYINIGPITMRWIPKGMSISFRIM